MGLKISTDGKPVTVYRQDKTTQSGATYQQYSLGVASKDKDGNWVELLKGKFTCDGTGRQELRRDYEGGVTEDGNFYLRNIGYVDEHVEYGTEFERKGNGKAPEIDFKELIKLSKSTDDRSKF